MILSVQILYTNKNYYISLSKISNSFLLLNILAKMMLVLGSEQLVGRQHLYQPSAGSSRKWYGRLYMKRLSLTCTPSDLE